MEKTKDIKCLTHAIMKAFDGKCTWVSVEARDAFENEVMEIITNEDALQCREVCVFETFTQWVNHARSWIKYDKRAERIICLDKEGFMVETGIDFQMSRSYSRYPVTVYAIRLSRDGVFPF